MACGGGGEAGNGVRLGEQFAAKLGKAANNTARFAIETHLPEGTLQDAGLAVTTAIDRGTSFRESLRTLAASDDPYGKAIQQAFCQGLSNLASYKDNPAAGPATEQSWTKFLVGQVQTILEPRFVLLARAKVNMFVTSANLSAIDPRLAATYYRACVN